MSQLNKERIITISRKLGLSHIGSNISCLPVLEEIYAKKKAEDIVILDNAHAHLAHLLFIQRFNVEKFIKEYGIHCDRKVGCDASGGSLGHGIGIGIGYAIANPEKQVYVIVSDGSMMEGSNWEALRIAGDLYKKELMRNLHIRFNFNGYTAVENLKDTKSFYPRRLEATIYQLFGGDKVMYQTDNGEGFEGVQGHYKVIK